MIKAISFNNVNFKQNELKEPKNKKEYPISEQQFKTNSMLTSAGSSLFGGTIVWGGLSLCKVGKPWAFLSGLAIAGISFVIHSAIGTNGKYHADYLEKKLSWETKIQRYENIQDRAQRIDNEITKKNL